MIAFNNNTSTFPNVYCKKESLRIDPQKDRRINIAWPLLLGCVVEHRPITRSIDLSRGLYYWNWCSFCLLSWGGFNPPQLSSFIAKAPNEQSSGMCCGLYHYFSSSASRPTEAAASVAVKANCSQHRSTTWWTKASRSSSGLDKIQSGVSGAWPWSTRLIESCGICSIRVSSSSTSNSSSLSQRWSHYWKFMWISSLRNVIEKKADVLSSVDSRGEPFVDTS